MSELICEQLAHSAGFPESVGNWIAPNGDLIYGRGNKHHLTTIMEYRGVSREPENALHWMNQCVNEGFIRLVFRCDIVFQVDCSEVVEIWGERTNYRRMREILSNLLLHDDVDIHIFSQNLYLIGSACSIIEKKMNNIQIKENR